MYIVEYYNEHKVFIREKFTERYHAQQFVKKIMKNKKCVLVCYPYFGND